MDNKKLQIAKDRLILKKSASEMGEEWDVIKSMIESKTPEYIFVQNIKSRHYAKKSDDIKKQTEYFIEYSDNLLEFYNDLSKKYFNQNKAELSNELPWLKDDERIKGNEICCAYCGVSERILEGLYNNNFRTKRGRGAWFEIDRMNAEGESNVYTKENMVLCCYFCNNHKSDVISVDDMRNYFGQPMFKFLMSKYKEVKSKK